MILIFLSLSLLIRVIRFIIFDPIKSSFFLIFSLLLRIPILSLLSLVWFSYFVCLLFLRGIFVILVYFSSLSKLVFVSRNLLLVLLALTFLFQVLSFSDQDFVSLRTFYNIVYLPLLLLILLVLILFINFRSYFLNFSGALRKF